MIECFLPEGLLTHFEVTSILELGDISTKKMIFEIHLDENFIFAVNNSRNEIFSLKFHLNSSGVFGFAEQHSEKNDPGGAQRPKTCPQTQENFSLKHVLHDMTACCLLACKPSPAVP